MLNISLAKDCQLLHLDNSILNIVQFWLVLCLRETATTFSWAVWDKRYLFDSQCLVGDDSIENGTRNFFRGNLFAFNTGETKVRILFGINLAKMYLSRLLCNESNQMGPRW